MWGKIKLILYSDKMNKMFPDGYTGGDTSLASLLDELFLRIEALEKEDE